MFHDKKNKLALDLLSTLLGCTLMAFAITSILKPNGLIMGGVTGISIILDKVTGISYSYIFYTISLLILFITLIVLGKKEARKILLLSIVFPVFILVFSFFSFNFTNNDLLLSSVYFGIIGGLGAGFILKSGFSSGGTDTIAKMIHKKILPQISISQILVSIDVIIIVCSIYVFDIRIALYAILTQLVFMKAIESVLFGFTPKMVKLEIISEKHNEIENFILYTVNRGLSKANIVGCFTNTERTKLITICSQRQSIMIKEYLKEIDRNAFTTVLPVTSVWGEGVGFSQLNDED